MKPPDFWWKDGNTVWPALLEPAARLYGWAARRRFESARPSEAGVPVVCVGNLVVGGAGKTPVVLDIGNRLIARGAGVNFLSRGYKGSLAGPVRVDADIHSFRDVGDEPLLLARRAPTWVSRDRAAGCRAAARRGAGIIVMDDGFQNPQIAKDFSFVVVDARRGFGNGRLLPAGPLREPVAVGLARADAVVLLGETDGGIAEDIKAAAGRDFPVLQASVKPEPETRDLVGRPVVAFSGIGDPVKFFATLRNLGCRLEATHAFPDHHAFTNGEIEKILAEAERRGALPVTTEKDAERLTAEVRNRVRVLTIRVEWEDEEVIMELLEPLICA